MYVVFDNLFHIGAFCTHSNVPMGTCSDRLLKWPDQSVEKLDSQFEGIVYNSLQDTYYIAQEAIPTIDDETKFQPNIFEVRIGKNQSNANIQIIESCRVEMEFESDGKGFEGLEFVVSQTRGKTYLFGLCEANKCASSLPKKITADDLGHGRLVVLEKKAATKKSRIADFATLETVFSSIVDPCSWIVIDMIKLPSSIQFLDYSAISIYRGDSSTFPTSVAITSQENSQVWIGLIEEIPQSPFFQISSLDKDVSYNVPRAAKASDDCSIKYCNIEGVAWQDENQLILVSDKSKKDQAAMCEEEGQSIHYMVLPE